MPLQDLMENDSIEEAPAAKAEENAGANWKPLITVIVHALPSIGFRRSRGPLNVAASASRPNRDTCVRRAHLPVHSTPGQGNQ
jgi:hypothetical protein